VRSGHLHRLAEQVVAAVAASDEPYAQRFALGRTLAKLRAQVAQAGAVVPRELTGPGTILGTAQYMSPEQATGKTVDARSDIFSFGAILYEMLSGKRAFKRETAADTMSAILKEEPPEASGSGRSISPGLDHVVRHCLSKDRTDRFQSVKDIAFSLSEISTQAVTGGLPAAAPMTAGARVVGPPGRKGAVLVGTAVLTIAVAAGYLTKRWQQGAGETGGPKRVAVLPFENLGVAEDEYFADGIADEIRTKLTSVPGIEVIARASSVLYKKTTKTPRQIADELTAPYLLTATVRWQKAAGVSRVQVTPELVDLTRPGAPTSRWQQRFDAALTDVFRVQADIATRVTESMGVALGATTEKRLAEKPTQDLDAYEAFLKGDAATKGMADTDTASLRKALVLYEQAVALDPRFTKAWARISNTNTLLFANATPTPALSQRAREAAEKAIALAPDEPDGYQALGTYYRLVQNDFGRAVEQYEQGQRRAPGTSLVSIAMVEQALGRWESALAHLELADRQNPRSVGGKRVLGMSLLRMRRYPEAHEAIDRALALSPANIDSIEYKAMVFLAQGDLPRARAVITRALENVQQTELVAYFAYYWSLIWVLDDAQRELLLRLTPGAFDDDRAQWALALAQASSLKGDAAGVRRYAEEARKAFELQLVSVPENSDRHVELGIALALLGRKEDAIREGTRAVELDPVAKDGYGGPFVQHELARIYIFVGEPEKALDRLEPLLKIPYILSPGWLAIDPNFDPLRKNARFQKLIGRAK
jgi:TolB-like protein/Flp pilus assembly protein TadD